MDTSTGSNSVEQFICVYLPPCFFLLLDNHNKNLMMVVPKLMKYFPSVLYLDPFAEKFRNILSYNLLKVGGYV